MNKTYSANMFKTFEESTEKYKMQYIDKIFLPQDTALSESGKNLHALINYYLKGFDISKFIPSLNEKEKNLWNNFINLNIAPKNVYKTEYIFNQKIEDKYWLTGRIDAIIKNNDNYIIYDWKTGSISENQDNEPQTILYLFCIYNKLIKENLITAHEQLSFIYINLKNSKTSKIILNNNKHNIYKKYIIKSINEIESAFKNIK